VQDVTGIVNLTHTIIDNNISDTVLWNFSEHGDIIKSSDPTDGYADGVYNITYSYLADSSASTAIDDGTTEVSNISTNWLGLIVTIAILSIIVVLIVTGFARRT